MINKIITSKGVIDIIIPADARTADNGELYIICPICSPERKPAHQNERKLAINMRKQPRPWRCNHCGEGGYVIDDDYMKNAKFKPIISDLHLQPLSNGLISWFWNKRGISVPTLRAMNISMSIEGMKQMRVPPEQEHLKDQWIQRKCINFKYFKDNVLINIKYRDQYKNFKMIVDASKTIYNIDSFKGKKKGIITEGEIDVLSYIEAGLADEYGIGSVPNGATITPREKEQYENTGIMTVMSDANLEYLDSVIDELKDIEIFYLATDDDPPGIKLREELARRLGKERCRYIKFSDYNNSEGKPINDPNELLVEKGPDALAATIDASLPFPIDGISVSSDYWDIVEKYYDHGGLKGIPTGFPALDPYFNWMKGWLYVQSGYPNSGKSSFMYNLIAASIVLYKWKWGIYSPENYPIENIIATFAEIFTGKSLDKTSQRRLSKIEYNDIVNNFMNKYLFFLNDDEGYTPEDLREVKKTLIRQHGIVGFYTDPWSSLIHNYRSQDNEDKYLEHELSKEVRFTTHNDIINVISHHPKTPVAVDKAPTVFSLTGGKVWWIKAYSIFCIHRRHSDDWKNMVTEFHVQKNKDFKAAGELTSPVDPPTFSFDIANRRFYGQRADDLSVRDYFPFKTYHEANQAMFEGF
jgi:twinkle protein